MSSSDISPRRPAEIALTLGVLVALLAAMMPLLRVVSGGPWVVGAFVLVGAILAAGFLARRYRLPAVAVSLIEAAVWLVLTTLLFLRDTALLGILPTPETMRDLPEIIGSAMDEIVRGAAPLVAGMPLSFLIVASMGILAIVIDHVVLTARMPLLAGVGLIAISLIPSIAVPADIDVSAIVLLAAAILFLLRAETRTRDNARERAGLGDPRAGRDARVRQDLGAARPIATSAGGASATALGIGAIGVIVAIVATPLLPPPARPAAGVGVGTSIDPTLALGDDLRRPTEVEVLKVRSNAPNAPYLRAATLSRFDGSEWEPDFSRTVSL